MAPSNTLDDLEKAGMPAGFQAVTLPPHFYEVAPPKGQEAKKEPVKPDQYSVIGGAIMDTLGLTDRPGAVPLTGAPGTKTPLGVVLKPEGLLEHATSAAVTAAPIAKAGALGAKALSAAPRLGAALGRSVAAGGLGAAEAAAKGHSPVAGGVTDAATAAATEGVLGLLPRAKIPYLTKSIKELTQELGSRNRAYEYATKAIGDAFEAVKDRIPKGRWLNIPTISKTGRLTPKEAQAGLETLEGIDYQQARGEIISELNALDIQKVGVARKGPRPYAGQAFGMRTSPERFTPPVSTSHKFAEKASGALASPATRTLADEAMTQKVYGDIPFGALAGAAALEELPLLKHVPGSGLVQRAGGH